LTNPPFHDLPRAAIVVNLDAEVILRPAGPKDEFRVPELVLATELDRVTEPLEGLGLVDVVGLVSVRLEEQLRVRTS
jgi:hypothetical protein